jgi:hypothetical protein
VSIEGVLKCAGSVANDTSRGYGILPGLLTVDPPAGLIVR